MSLVTPFQAVRLRPAVAVIPWGQARIAGATLTVVDLIAPVDVTGYAGRDFELAYRDVILTALLAELSVAAGEIFGADLTRPAVQGVPTGTLDAVAGDMATLALAGGVDHVVPSSIPLDAVEVDRQLYARDVLLHESLAEVAEILEDPPITTLFPNGVNIQSGFVSRITFTDAWSLAEGGRRRAAVSGSLPLSVALFKAPDQELAGRDNDLAAAIAQLGYELNDIYGHATRLLMQITDTGGAREPELYVLKSDDGRYRRFVVQPGLVARNQIIYDRALRTVSWYGESTDDSGLVPFAGRLTLPYSESTLVLRTALSERQDSAFWRQKSKRLTFDTYRTNPLYFQPNPGVDVTVTDGAIYQPTGVFLPAAGAGVTLTPSIPSPSVGHYRLAIYFEPSRVARLYGSLNLNGVLPDDAETATLTAQGTLLNWQLKLIEGRYTVRFRFADLLEDTDSFKVRVLWNAQVVFEGFLLYGKDAGTFTFSNSYVVSSSGEVGSFTIQRTDDEGGNLTIGVVEFTNVRQGNLSCSLVAVMGTVTATSVFSSQSGRPDTLFFDFFSTTPDAIQLTLSDVNIGGIYLLAFDIRKFGAHRETPNTIGYRKWKRTYIINALEAVRRGFTLSTPADGVPTFANATVWGKSATESWLNYIESLELNVRVAFRVGRPGDIGQPALTPPGLYYDIENREVRQTDPSNSFPVMQAFQAWMIGAGIYVFHEDFWIEEFWPNAPISDCDFITADFTAVTVISEPPTTVVYENTPQTCSDTCPEGFTGDYIEVTVDAGTYASSISQEDADAQAMADACAQVAALRLLSPCEEDLEIEPSSLWGFGDNLFHILGTGDLADKTTPTIVGESAGLEWTKAAGYEIFSVGLKSDGTLWSWGGNYSGNLGHGTISAYPSTAYDEFFPRQIGTDSDWVDIDVGGAWAVAIKQDGTLWAWGDNTYGQLGLNDTTMRLSPTQVGVDTDWFSVSCGDDHGLALKSNGTMWAVGRGNAYQLGNGLTGDLHVFTQIGVGSTWASLACGIRHSAAIKTDGTISMWGEWYTGSVTTITQIGSDSDWDSAASGEHFLIAIKTDGTIHGVGSNEQGQLGTGDTTPSASFQQIGSDAIWDRLSCGQFHVLAHKTDGTIWGWGLDLDGQLGQGSLAGDRPNPVQIGPDTLWTGVGTGFHHSFGFRSTVDDPPPPAGTSGVGFGGVLTIAGGYHIHRFDYDNTFVVLDGSGVSFDRLIVGGGAGGGGLGGGGCGEFNKATGISLANGNYPVVVGARGLGVLGGLQGHDGTGSSFNGTTCTGGGGGGGYDNSSIVNGKNGAGGGGGGAYISPDTNGTGGAGSPEGNGGTGSAVFFGAGGGGGGGAGGNGSNGSSTGSTGTGGTGGAGTSDSITGAAVIYAAGGGGGGMTASGNGGSSNVGGKGADDDSAIDGSDGTTAGSGGGGGGATATWGGNGARGAVVIRYLSPP